MSRQSQKPESHRRALELFRQHGGILRTKDVLGGGVHPRTLYELRENGSLQMLSRGVYRLADAVPLADLDLITVALRAPHAIVCLTSALKFHGLCAQTPDDICLAIARGTEPPRIDRPPISVFRFSGKSLSEGIETHELDGVTLRVYGPEKTIADCCYFRNKFGFDVCLEALRTYAQQDRVDADALLHFADIRRVSRVLAPYLKAIVNINASTTVDRGALAHSRDPDTKRSGGLSQKSDQHMSRAREAEPATRVKGTSGSSGEGASMRVVDRLLLDPPSDSNFYQFRVGKDAPIAREPTAKVAVGDELTIDTNVFRGGDPARLDQRMVVVDVAGVGEPDLRLGVATVDPATDASQSDVARVRVPGWGELITELPKTSGDRHSRGLDFSESPDFSKPEASLPRTVERGPSKEDAVETISEAAVGAETSASDRPPHGYARFRNIDLSDHSRPNEGDITSDTSPVLQVDRLKQVTREAAAERSRNQASEDQSDEQVSEEQPAAAWLTTRVDRDPECLRGVVIHLGRAY